MHPSSYNKPSLHKLPCFLSAVRFCMFSIPRNFYGLICQRSRPITFREGTPSISTDRLRRRVQIIAGHWSSTPEMLKPVDSASHWAPNKARLLKWCVCAVSVTKE